MKQYLESSLKLSQLQARLTKKSYLSQQSLPSHADAKVFLLIEKSKKTPDRSTHPHLYHWYIIMSQFASRTLLKWIEANEQAEEEDQLIDEFVFEMSGPLINPFQQPSQTNQNDSRIKRMDIDRTQASQRNINTPKNTHKRRINQNYVQSNENILTTLKETAANKEKEIKSSTRERTPLNIITHKNDTCSPLFDLQCIMEMQLNIQKDFPLEVIRERLIKEKIQILSFQLQEEIHLRVFYRIDKNDCQELKDRISKWSQVSNIRFRKQKKMGSRLEIKSQNSLASPIRKIPYL